MPDQQSPLSNPNRRKQMLTRSLVALITLASLTIPGIANAACPRATITNTSVTVQRDNFVRYKADVHTRYHEAYYTAFILNERGRVVLFEPTEQGDPTALGLMIIDHLPWGTPAGRRYSIELRVSNGRGCSVSRRTRFLTRRQGKRIPD